MWWFFSAAEVQLNIAEPLLAIRDIWLGNASRNLDFVSEAEILDFLWTTKAVRFMTFSLPITVLLSKTFALISMPLHQNLKGEFNIGKQII